MKEAKDFFSPQDLREIETAVKSAEERTSGEIVPYVVSHADDYHEAYWKGAVFGMLAFVGLALAIHYWGGFWGGPLAAWMSLPALGGAAAGFLLPLLWPGARRLLATSARMDCHVQLKARAVFIEEEIFHTRERTGILIFLSLFERRVTVLCDSGINSRVAQAVWDEIVDRITAGIRAGHPGRALAVAIGSCAMLLERRGVAAKPGDVNELPDGLLLGRNKP